MGSCCMTSDTETKHRQFDNIVVNGGTVRCYVTIIGSDNGLSPGRRQAIIRTNARYITTYGAHQWRQSCQIDELFFSVPAISQKTFKKNKKKCSKKHV